MGDLLSFRIGRRKDLRRATPATTWYERGLALEACDPAAARLAYERALSSRPDLADAHNNLGRLDHDQGQLAVAESRYRIALCLRDDIALYWFNLGVVVEDQRRSSEAISAYERALAIDPELADAHYNLARLYELSARHSGNELVLHRAVRHLVRYRNLTTKHGTSSGHR